MGLGRGSGCNPGDRFILLPRHGTNICGRDLMRIDYREENDRQYRMDDIFFYSSDWIKIYG
jgi:hypothetical protein